MISLGEDYPKQQARMRVLLDHGRSVGAVGHFYCTMIEDVLRRADKAVMEQDLPAMVRIYKEMEAFKE